MSYSLKHLQYLVAVSEEKSFSKAASRCNVTQSTLSLGIQELERQIDITLFERSRKNIIPTAAGYKAVGYAKEILAKSESFSEEMRGLTNPEAGPLRIGVIPTIAPYYLPKALPILEKAFPEGRFQISEDTTETIIHKITEGKMDLGILAFPIHSSDLDHRILFKEDFVLVTPKTTHLPQKMTTEIIEHLDILLLREGHCLKDHILSACKLPPEKQNRFFEAESLHTLLAMVNQGYGCTLLPDMAVRADLVKLFPDIKLRRFIDNPPTRQIGLVWRRTDIRRNTFGTVSLSQPI